MNLKILFAVLKTKKTNFKYSKKQELKPLLEIKTEWDLSVYYSKNPEKTIEKELAAIEHTFTKFAKKHKNEAFLSSSNRLRAALDEYFALDELRPEKALRYYSYRKVKNVSDKEAQRASNRIQMRLTKASNLLLFFPLAIINLPRQTMQTYLKDSKLKPYRYFLSQLSKQRPHTLSNLEEQILQRKRLPARDLWMNATDTILGERSVTFAKKQHSLLSAIEWLPAISPKERLGLWKVITRELQAVGEIAEHEFTAVLLDKSINDELRHYPKPYSSTVVSYENEIESVENLVKTVTSEGFKSSRQYYTAKAKAHNLDTFTYTDRYRTLGELPTVPFDQAVDILRDVLYGFDPKYGKFFDELLVNGRIDVYPRDKKEGGAFMAAGVHEPILIHLNHTDSFTTLETLAHEVGHAIHSYCSQTTQPTYYQEYSTVTAETASTFFEQLLFDKVYEQLSEKKRRVMLEYKLDRITATIMRQVAFFNYELQIHEHVRKHGAIENATLARLLQKEIQRYMGKDCTVSEADGYSYVYIGHFRRMFYVYTYAYGHLMSQLMLKKYYEDSNYAQQIGHFLGMGGSNTVENIYRSIGIEPTDPDVFKSGLRSYKEDVKNFRSITT